MSNSDLHRPIDSCYSSHPARIKMNLSCGILGTNYSKSANLL